MSDDFTIPVSIREVDESTSGWPRRNLYCWECGSRENVNYYGVHPYCGGCRASMRQEARQVAADMRNPTSGGDDAE